VASARFIAFIAGEMTSPLPAVDAMFIRYNRCISPIIAIIAGETTAPLPAMHAMLLRCIHRISVDNLPTFQPSTF
jgi:hypothetical protein